MADVHASTVEVGLLLSQRLVGFSSQTRSLDQHLFQEVMAGLGLWQRRVMAGKGLG